MNNNKLRTNKPEIQNIKATEAEKISEISNRLLLNMLM